VALANLRLAVGGPPWPTIVPVAWAAASAFFAWALQRGQARPRAGTAAAVWGGVLALFAAWVVLEARVFDGSYDGQNYHGVAVLLVLDGWNPLLGDVPIGGFEAAPIRHFPKGAWLAEAALARLVGSFEAGKAFTPLLVSASVLLLGAAVALRRRRLSRRDAALVLVVAANPVAIKNLFTHMTDGQVAALLVCIAAYVLILRDRRDAAVLAGLAFATALSVNLKFTGLVFAALVGGGGVAWHAVRRRPWRAPAAALLAGLVVGAGALGYAPYVRNALEHGSPFHPLSARSGRIPAYTPPNLQGRTRVEKLVISAFSETDARPGLPARPKLPVAVEARELRSAAAYDTRVGGFGPLFGVELVLTVVLLAQAAFTRRRVDADVLAVAGLLLVTSALFPEPWWARWIPQLWAVPLLAVLALGPLSAATAPAVSSGTPGRARSAAARWLDVAVIALAAANGAIAAAANGARVAVRDREIAVAHRAAAAMHAPVEVQTLFPQVVQARLAEAGVPSRLVRRVGCAEPLTVPPEHARICPADERPPTRQPGPSPGSARALSP
jgi:hypothetical protein